MQDRKDVLEVRFEKIHQSRSNLSVNNNLIEENIIFKLFYRLYMPTKK